MNTDSILTAPRLPARLDTNQTAKLLGFAPEHIAILVAHDLLKPLGKPAANAPKYFATVEVEQRAEDSEWLHKATKTLSNHWAHKNRNRREIKQPEVAAN